MTDELGIKIVTDFSQSISRLKVPGLYSLNYALRNRRTMELGIPLNCIIEPYGYEHVGKSTLAQYIAASLRPYNENALILNMNVDEGVPDVHYTAYIASLAGYKGTIEYINHLTKKGKPRTHEDMLYEMVSRMDEADVGVLDSVGAFQGTSATNDKSGFGTGFTGAKRAITIGEACREILNAFRNSETDKSFIFVNHQHQAVGGRGHRTPGGQALKNAAAVRIRFWRSEHYFVDPQTRKQITGYLAEGQVEKNRYGGTGDYFQLFFLEGRGLHPGLTAMFDCKKFGLAEFGTTVKMDGESYGYINATLIKAALDGDDATFQPFIKKLEDHFAELEKQAKEEPDKEPDKESE